ncbi:MAG: hypothetical protein WC755_02025 [Candidatus Woesearchaeota archaeon]|jgi:hypothetical protein
MKRWQVIEREGVTSGWSVPRTPYAIEQFNSKAEALVAARKYVTELNVDNALASGEKETAAEVFLVDDVGCYLGDLDGKPWYMKYKKDVTVKDSSSGEKKTLHKTGEIVKDATYFELDKKGEVAVREVPGT